MEITLTGVKKRFKTVEALRAFVGERGQTERLAVGMRLQARVVEERLARLLNVKRIGSEIGRRHELPARASTAAHPH